MADDDRSLADLQDEAEARGLPKYGTKAELAERIDAYDDESAPESDDDGGEAEEAGGGDVEPGPPADRAVDVADVDDPNRIDEPVRAGGHVNRGEGKGWELDDTSKEHPPPDPRDDPVDPGNAGLPGNPVMGTAVGPVRTEE